MFYGVASPTALHETNGFLFIRITIVADAQFSLLSSVHGPALTFPIWLTAYVYSSP